MGETPATVMRRVGTGGGLSLDLRLPAACCCAAPQPAEPHSATKSARLHARPRVGLSRTDGVRRTSIVSISRPPRRDIGHPLARPTPASSSPRNFSGGNRSPPGHGEANDVEWRILTDIPDIPHAAERADSPVPLDTCVHGVLGDGSDLCDRRVHADGHLRLERRDEWVRQLEQVTRSISDKFSMVLLCSRTDRR